jgi:hypothetical protein
MTEHDYVATAKRLFAGEAMLTCHLNLQAPSFAGIETTFPIVEFSNSS